MPDKEVNIRVTTTAQTKALKATEKALEEINKELKENKKLTREQAGALKQARTQLQRASTGVQSAAKSQRNLGLATLEASRAFEDFALGGLRGVLNNLPVFLSQMGVAAGLVGTVSAAAVGLSLAFGGLSHETRETVSELEKLEGFLGQLSKDQLKREQEAVKEFLRLQQAKMSALREEASFKQEQFRLDAQRRGDQEALDIIAIQESPLSEEEQIRQIAAIRAGGVRSRAGREKLATRQDAKLEREQAVTAVEQADAEVARRERIIGRAEEERELARKNLEEARALLESLEAAEAITRKEGKRGAVSRESLSPEGRAASDEIQRIRDEVLRGRTRDQFLDAAIARSGISVDALDAVRKQQAQPLTEARERQAAARIALTRLDTLTEQRLSNVDVSTKRQVAEIEVSRNRQLEAARQRRAQEEQQRAARALTARGKAVRGVAGELSGLRSSIGSEGVFSGSALKTVAGQLSVVEQQLRTPGDEPGELQRVLALLERITAAAAALGKDTATSARVSRIEQAVRQLEMQFKANRNAPSGS